jgi:hypothetical protein
MMPVMSCVLSCPARVCHAWCGWMDRTIAVDGGSGRVVLVDTSPATRGHVWPRLGAHAWPGVSWGCVAQREGSLARMCRSLSTDGQRKPKASRRLCSDAVAPQTACTSRNEQSAHTARRNVACTAAVEFQDSIAQSTHLLHCQKIARHG